MRNKFLIFIIFTLTGCGASKIENSTRIRIKGSDTMFLLNQKLAEQFMIENPGISVYVDGGGTESGVKALLNNSVEICAASRPLESDEIKKMGDNYNSVGLSFLIGRDALSIYLNSENNIKNLSLEQLSEIFECKINNWKDIGGFDKPILPISRFSASGTHLYFIKHILKGEDICKSIPSVNTTNEIVEFVRQNINAIGYGGIGYADSSMQICVNGIAPTKENVINNSYPISRYLRYYTSQKPSGNIKKFIDWTNSDEGQKIVEAMGYIPLWN